MKTAIVIPARLASTRFPEKMLAKINGKSLIRTVYDQCLETGFDVYVVTDSEKSLPRFLILL
jgi:3-deoxy-manno-octulosonate cytidylyltransferase (CMP-KDO synthetase)